MSHAKPQGEFMGFYSETVAIVASRLSPQQLQTLVSSLERKYQPRSWFGYEQRWKKLGRYTVGYGLALPNPPRFWPLPVLQQWAWLHTSGYSDAATALLELHAPKWGGVDELVSIAGGLI